MPLTNFTRDNFDREISAGTVLVDFYGDNCTHCRRLSPLVERTALRCGNVKFGKVDVEAERELAGRYGIFAIPTLILFRDGEEVKRSVGAIPEEKLADLIKS